MQGLGTFVTAHWPAPSARLASAQTRAGSPARIVVTLDVPDGCHVQAHHPGDPFLIPTELSFDGSEGITILDVAYPPEEIHRFDWTPVELRVFRGTVEIVATVEIAADTTPGPRTLSGRIRYQGCTGSACLPPVEQAFDVALDVV